MREQSGGIEELASYLRPSNKMDMELFHEYWNELVNGRTFVGLKVSVAFKKLLFGEPQAVIRPDHAQFRSTSSACSPNEVTLVKTNQTHPGNEDGLFYSRCYRRRLHSWIC
jgi:hypothetical protein